MNNLPTDIIHDIFTRFPTELNILSRNGYASGSFSLYSIKKTSQGEITAKKSQINLHQSLDLQNMEVKLFTSYNGCFLFTSPSAFLIFNPITSEQVTVSKPYIMPLFPEFNLLGFYLHKNTQEHRILCVHENRVKIYGVKSSTWRSTSSMMEDLPRKKNPVIVNGAMHWLVYFQEAGMYQIQIFDIESEKLGRIGVPVNLTKYVRGFEIVEMSGDDGRSTIGFCDNCTSMEIDIWMLEDYANQVWKMRRKIFLYGIRGETNVSCYGVEVVWICNKDELVVKWGGQYYHHNFKLDTWSKILGLGGYIYGEAIHQNSLISLLV